MRYMYVTYQISFFLWEIDNPPTEMCLAYGTLALGPRLFVSVSIYY